MPFKSKSQMRACYAKKDPKWDCEAWAKETGNTKNLPEKKKASGGRMGDCKRCGGKKTFQAGGRTGSPGATSNLDQLIDWTILQHNLFDPNKSSPKADATTMLPSPVQGFQFQGPQNVQSRNVVNQYYPEEQDIPEVPKENKPWDPRNLGIGLRAATTGLGWLSGIVERGRQNKYMYDQFSTLGQIDPVPVQNFQPNRYSLYAKYGGSLKKYQRGGTLDAYAKDFARRKGHLNPEETYVAPNAPVVGMDGNPFQAIPTNRRVQYTLPQGVDPNQLKAYQNEFWYDDPQTGDAVFVDPSVFNKYRPQPSTAMAKLKKGGKWLQKAVNPEHKGYCTPMTKPTCTGHRRAFAKMMKEKHGFHKK